MRDAKIRQDQVALIINEHILWLDVAMDHLLRVDVIQSGSGLPDILAGILQGDFLQCFNFFGKRAMLIKRHDKVRHTRVLSPVIDLDNMWMARIIHDLVFAFEALKKSAIGIRVPFRGALGQKHLDGAGSTHRLICSKVHASHAPLPDKRMDMIAVFNGPPNNCSGIDNHGLIPRERSVELCLLHTLYSNFTAKYASSCQFIAMILLLFLHFNGALPAIVTRASRRNGVTTVTSHFCSPVRNYHRLILCQLICLHTCEYARV